MDDTAARLLRTLQLLHVRSLWPSTDLANRLEVSQRTVRRDIDRLRSLGYRITADRSGRGYHLDDDLGAPPMVLDQRDVLAIAVGLRTASATIIPDSSDAAEITLAKLLDRMPTALRRPGTALRDHTVAATRNGPAPSVDLLAEVTSACRDRCTVAFDYADNDGRASTRTVEPHTAVFFDRRWYLVGWDVSRADWRTFRIDRITSRLRRGARFAERPPPDEQLDRYVTEQVAKTLWSFRATVTVAASASTLRLLRLPPSWLIEVIDDHSCRIHTGAASARQLAHYLGGLHHNFSVDDNEQLRAELGILADRYAHAASQSPTSAHDAHTHA